MANWIKDWQQETISNREKFTMTSLTASAFEDTAESSMVSEQSFIERVWSVSRNERWTVFSKAQGFNIIRKNVKNKMFIEREDRY